MQASQTLLYFVNDFSIVRRKAQVLGIENAHTPYTVITQKAKLCNFHE